MIDNYSKALELMEKMKKHLPIPAFPTKQLILALKDSEIKITKDMKLQIDMMHYMGDEGGISCSISLQKDSKMALVTSITQIRIPFSHPVYKEIARYQKKRIKKLVERIPRRKPYHTSR